jgi:hypothetical protein
LNLFAAFDTRTGKVYGQTAGRKRQAEFLAFLVPPLTTLAMNSTGLLC